MEHISYRKIRQFNSTIKEVKKDAKHHRTLAPTDLSFKGTVKLHGTNSSVCYNSKDKWWVQSRKRILSVENDNYDFACFATKNKEIFMSIINKIMIAYKVDTSKTTIAIFGEWVGKGIQKGVGVSALEKSFFIIEAKLVSITDPEDCRYIPCPFSSPYDRIYNINNYPTYKITIDFTNPKESQDKLVSLTSEVEKECPVAKAFGAQGIGEGIVWKDKSGRYIFKVKGEKHSVRKPKNKKNLAPVSEEKLKNIKEFVDYAVTDNRVKQAITEVYGEECITTEKLGDILKWINKDIIEEELEVLLKNEMVWKDVVRDVCNRTKKMFFELMKEINS